MCSLNTFFKTVTLILTLYCVQEPVEDLDPERILDLQADSRLHVISGGTKVVQHSPPLKASAGLKRKLLSRYSVICL